jgi:hypothetical protein
MKFFKIYLFLLLLNSSKSTAQITGIKVVGDTCDNFSLTLQALGTSFSSYLSWNFNDPASGVNDTITINGSSASVNPIMS